jgi:hypothetical protein
MPVATMCKAYKPRATTTQLGKSITMRFVLIDPIHLSDRSQDTIPAGATGTINRSDDYHLQLTFDRKHNRLLTQWGDILILDEHDTELTIWKAIHLTGPNPYRCGPISFDVGSLPCHKNDNTAIQRSICVACT